MRFGKGKISVRLYVLYVCVCACVHVCVCARTCECVCVCERWLRGRGGFAKGTWSSPDWRLQQAQCGACTAALPLRLAKGRRQQRGKGKTTGSQGATLTMRDVAQVLITEGHIQGGHTSDHASICLHILGPVAFSKSLYLHAWTLCNHEEPLLSCLDPSQFLRAFAYICSGLSRFDRAFAYMFGPFAILRSLCSHAWTRCNF